MYMYWHWEFLNVIIVTFFFNRKPNRNLSPKPKALKAPSQNQEQLKDLGEDAQANSAEQCGDMEDHEHL